MYLVETARIYDSQLTPVGCPVDLGFVYITNNIQVITDVKTGIVRLHRSPPFIKTGVFNCISAMLITIHTSFHFFHSTALI